MFFVRAVSSTANSVPQTVSNTTGPAFDWKEVKETFYTPTDYTDSRFDLMWGLAIGETANVDDVMLCEGKDCLPKQITINTQTQKIGDIDNSGVVDIFDYNILLTNFGKTG